MRRTLLAAAAAMAFVVPAFAEATPEQIQAAIADAARPAADTERDAARHPAELVAFAQVKQGDVVVDWIPGSGYFTRLFSGVVGEGGKVYAWVPKEIAANYDLGKLANELAAERKNVVAVIEPLMATASIANADVVWTSQNYHDLYADFMGKPDVGAFNKQVFDMLKPGGLYVIVDHVAATGSGHEAGNTVHRIDPALVRAEVESAGFVFDGESDVLRNPGDTHELLVFDPAIRGKTDQFVYRFRKPAA
jgi:predicted methyltransferase